MWPFGRSAASLVFKRKSGGDECSDMTQAPCEKIKQKPLQSSGMLAVQPCTAFMGRLPIGRDHGAQKALSTRLHLTSNPWLLMLLGALFGAFSGFIGWHGNHPYSITAALLCLLAWGLAKSRLHAAAVMFFYLMATGYTAPSAISHYSDWALTGALLAHIGYAALYGLIWGVLSRPQGSWLERSAAMLVGLSLMSVPPLGALYYGNPLIAAGALFPGLGFLGLAGTFMLVIACMALFPSAHQHKSRAKNTKFTSLSVLCLLVILSSVANLHALHHTPSPPIEVEAIHTHTGPYPKDVQARYVHQLAWIERAQQWIDAQPEQTTSNKSRKLLLPEGEAGHLEPRFAWMIDDLAERAAHKGVSVVVGMSEQAPQGGLLNTLHMVGAQNARWVATATAPLGMWRPWSPHHYPQRWWSTVERHAGVSALLCWEELLLWSWARTAARQPMHVLIASSTWYDATSSIDRAQRKSTWSMARLWGLSYSRASNIHKS